jgi:hypothetical protein
MSAICAVSGAKNMILLQCPSVKVGRCLFAIHPTGNVDIHIEGNSLVVAGGSRRAVCWKHYETPLNTNITLTPARSCKIIKLVFCRRSTCRIV